MSAFNMGEKLCKEYGCLCATLRANIDIHRLRSVKPVAFAATRICRSIHSSTIRRHTEEYQNARVIPGRRRQSR